MRTALFLAAAFLLAGCAASDTKKAAPPRGCQKCGCSQKAVPCGMAGCRCPRPEPTDLR